MAYDGGVGSYIGGRYDRGPMLDSGFSPAQPNMYASQLASTPVAPQGIAATPDPTGIMQGIGAITKGGVGLLQLGFQVWDYFETKKEMERLERERKAEQKRLEMKADARYEVEAARSNRNEALANQQTALSAGAQKFNQNQTLRNNFVKMLSLNPQLQNRMMQIWPGR